MMAAAMVRQGGRSFRSLRSRTRHESGEDYVKLDFSKDPAEIVKEVLTAATVQLHVCKAKKLGYLNAFVKLIHKLNKEKHLGYSKQDILCCLRVSLFHEAKEVRAATLRVLRYFVQDGETLDLLYKLHIDYLIVRSIDMCLDNEIERIHAIKLVRRIAHLAPHKLTSSLIYPLVAIGNDGSSERDRMVRVCLATICEIAYLNPELVARCGGIGTILRAALDCHQYPRINESLVCTILHLLNHPRTRHLIKFNTDLEQLLAPFTDCHYRYSASDSADHSTGDEKENRFAASKMAIVSIMRSWPGIIRFCRPDGSGLQSLVGILYLPYYEIRQGIIEILFDLFRLHIPEWTDNFSEALMSVDPSEEKDAWLLTDGFLCAEGRDLLPHLAKIRPNLVENHLALLMSAWIGAGILEALVEVIISSEVNLFIRATVLLGELLYLASSLLPNECSHHTHCLPSLMAMASSVDIPSTQRNRARLAVAYLDRIHAMKKRGIVPYSLYLDHMLQSVGARKRTQSRQFIQGKDKLHNSYISKLSSEEMMIQTVKDSQVLTTKENTVWDWDLVISVLKWPYEKQRKLDDQTLLKFIKRLTFYYKPTNHLFSRQETGYKLAKKTTHAGCHFIDFLLECGQEDANKLLMDYLNDIGQCLSEICSGRLAPEAVLSPGNIINTCSQFYFLFLGKFSTNVRGEKMLEKSGIYQYLLEIMSVATQDSFVKLSVSSLDYSKDATARSILSKALCNSTESARLYCTKFLRVLLRARLSGFSVWGVDMLITQLYDQSRNVALAALAVMEEACDVETCLNSLIKSRPSCLHLGDKGVLMMCRFVSTAKGFHLLMDANYISNELETWAKSFNSKYVFIIEEILDEALTTYEKTYEGSFTRRSNRKRPNKDAFLPVHLYSQLSQHKEGFQVLRQQECIEDYFQCIRCQELKTDEDILKLKTALWAVGHIGMSSWGVAWIEEERLLSEIIRLAEECGVFSIRGTAFYVLGLLASTREGAEFLTQLGWESCWHTREDRWPVVENRGELLGDLEDTASESNFSLSSMSRSEPDFRPNLHSPGLAPPNLFYIQEERTGSLDNGCDTLTMLHCDTNSNVDTTLSNIPPQKVGNISRSKTLPFESTAFKRYNSVPLRPHTIRSITAKNRDRTFSDNSDKRNQRRTNSQISEDRVCVSLTEEPKYLSSVGRESSSKEATVIPVICLPDSDLSEIETVKLTETEQSTDTVHKEDSKALDISSSEDSGIKMSENKSMQDYKTKQVKRSPNLKDGRSSSSDSSKSSKTRTDSFNTDSTTSGVSSFESGPQTFLSSDVVSLSPIASSTSLNTIGKQSTVSPDSKELIHHSSTRRKSLNLNRVPSLRKKQASPGYGILPSSRLLDNLTAENAIMYTSQRDAYGYATWRSIKRQRTYSSDLESDLGIGNLYDEDVASTTLSRKSSIDSKLSVEMYGASNSNLRLSLGMPRNASGVSLSEMDRPSSPLTSVPKAMLQRRRPHTGEAEFLGLTLPIDMNMIFEVHEGEDKRTQLPVEIVYKQSDTPITKRKTSSSGRRSRTTSTCKSEPSSFDHNKTVCLMCVRVVVTGPGGDAEPEEDIECESDGPGSLVIEDDDQKTTAAKGDRRSRLDSLNEMSSATPGSLTSCTSTDSPTLKMSLDSMHGRALIRQEMKKLVTNLSSSVGVKGSEQGLLGLKQKFPKVFQDLCFFSEVCYIMSACMFRMSARRFIQELFDDFDISKISEDGRTILGVTEQEMESQPSKNAAKPETLDSVWENFS